MFAKCNLWFYYFLNFYITYGSSNFIQNLQAISNRFQPPTLPLILMIFPLILYEGPVFVSILYFRLKMQVFQHTNFLIFINFTSIWDYLPSGRAEISRYLEKSTTNREMASRTTSQEIGRKLLLLIRGRKRLDKREEILSRCKKNEKKKQILSCIYLKKCCFIMLSYFTSESNLI